jgi:hypothetical protein
MAAIDSTESADVLSVIPTEALARGSPDRLAIAAHAMIYS